MITEPAIIAMRYPHKVTLLDVRKQGYRGVAACARALAPHIEPQFVIGSYFNERTNRMNVNVHFLTEKMRDEALDLIDEKFRHYRVF